MNKMNDCAIAAADDGLSHDPLPEEGGFEGNFGKSIHSTLAQALAITSSPPSNKGRDHRRRKASVNNLVTGAVFDNDAKMWVGDVMAALNRARSVAHANLLLTDLMEHRGQNDFQEGHEAVSSMEEEPNDAFSDSGDGLLIDLIESGTVDDGSGVHIDVKYMLLKLVLAAGMNPDLSDHQGHRLRASHVCAREARLEEANLLFLCRPDLQARNAGGETPMEIAQRTTYPEGDSPENQLLRPRVAEALKKFYEDGFPSVAQMACRQDWFAVLNLVRREVVSESELVKGTFGQRTAREWALHYKLFDIADELAFYVNEILNELSAMSSNLNKVDQRIDDMDVRLKACERSYKTSHTTRVPSTLENRSHQRSPAATASAAVRGNDRLMERLLDAMGDDHEQRQNRQQLLASSLTSSSTSDENQESSVLFRPVSPSTPDSVDCPVVDQSDETSSLELLIDDGVNVEIFS